MDNGRQFQAENNIDGVSNYFSAVKQRGRDNKGPPDISQNPSPKKGQDVALSLSLGVIGKSALEIGHFLGRNFGMISGGPFLSRPLCFTAEGGTQKGLRNEMQPYRKYALQNLINLPKQFYQ